MHFCEVMEGEWLKLDPRFNTPWGWCGSQHTTESTGRCLRCMQVCIFLFVYVSWKFSAFTWCSSWMWTKSPISKCKICIMVKLFTHISVELEQIPIFKVTLHRHSGSEKLYNWLGGSPCQSPWQLDQLYLWGDNATQSMNLCGGRELNWSSATPSSKSAEAWCLIRMSHFLKRQTA